MEQTRRGPCSAYSIATFLIPSGRQAGEITCEPLFCSPSNLSKKNVNAINGNGGLKAAVSVH